MVQMLKIMTYEQHFLPDKTVVNIFYIISVAGWLTTQLLIQITKISINSHNFKIILILMITSQKKYADYMLIKIKR